MPSSRVVLGNHGRFMADVVTISHHLPFRQLPLIILPPWFLSLRNDRKEERSLDCLHRRRSLAILGYAGPRWRTRLSLHLVLGLPCRLVHSRGVHSVTRLVHMLSLNRAMCPAHPCRPIAFLIMSMVEFTPV